MSLTKLAVTIPEACRALGISRTTAYTLFRVGALRTATIGRRRVVIWQSVCDFLDQRTSDPFAGANGDNNDQPE